MLSNDVKYQNDLLNYKQRIYIFKVSEILKNPFQRVLKRGSGAEPLALPSPSLSVLLVSLAPSRP